jgi:hypothetical protein
MTPSAPITSATAGDVASTTPSMGDFATLIQDVTAASRTITDWT